MKRFFREMKRMDKWILDSLHIHRSVHLAKLMVQFAPPVGAGLLMCHTAVILKGYVWSVASVIARSALLVFALMVVLSVAFVFVGFTEHFAPTTFWSTPASNTRSCSASARCLPRRDGSCLRLVPCFSSFTSAENGS